MKYPARHLAARFAAKEALSKAFGTGIGKSMGWRDLDVQKKESGEPFVVLSGGAEKMAKERGVDKIWITLSHTEQSGMATIILEGRGDSERRTLLIMALASCRLCGLRWN